MGDNEVFRYRTEQVPLTFWQRVDIWWKGVVDAIRAKPETHWTRWVQVRKGEPGCESAPFGFFTDTNPMRFTYENGEWMQVEPPKQETPPNPKWFDGQP